MSGRAESLAGAMPAQSSTAEIVIKQVRGSFFLRMMNQLVMSTL
jgi:hypothetical protein